MHRLQTANRPWTQHHDPRLEASARLQSRLRRPASAAALLEPPQNLSGEPSIKSFSAANLIVKPDGSLRYLTEPANRLEVSSLADTLREVSQKYLSRPPPPRLIAAAAMKPQQSALAVQAQQGALAVELPPPPPPETEVPAEYHVYDMEANRQAIVLANGDLGVEGGADTAAARYRIFLDAAVVAFECTCSHARWRMLRKAGPRTTDALRVGHCLSELVRQSFVRAPTEAS